MRILLCKLNHLGDTLLLTSAIRHLREALPGARIEVMVREGCEYALTGNPDVDSVWIVPGPRGRKRSWGARWRQFWQLFRGLAFSRPDWAFDLSHSDRAKIWILLSLARNRAINTAYIKPGIKLALFNRKTEFQWSQQHEVIRDYRTICAFFPGPEKPPPLKFVPAETLPADFNLPARRYVVIHPTSRWKFKEWVPERWAEIADLLHKESNLDVVFSCGPDSNERERVKAIFDNCSVRHYSTEGKLSIPETARLIANADLFLGVDTFTMHLAAAVQTPVVVLFGPSSAKAWSPWSCLSRVVSGDCPCRRTGILKCDKARTYHCMESIRVEDVLSAVSELTLNK